MPFSTDRDLLIFEPRLFAELAWPGQTLAGGADGELDRTTFTSASADFAAAAVASGMVLCISGATPAPAAFEIVSVDSPTALTVSALRRDPSAPPVAPTLSGDGLAWQIAGFAAQAQAVADEMIAAFGLAPADPSSPWTAEQVANGAALRTLSAWGVLATALAGAAARTGPPDGYWTKAVHYRGLFERGLMKVRLGLAGPDGSTAVLRHIAAPRLRRD